MITLIEERRAKRNQNPHKLAVLAMAWFGDEYARQNGGSMDFWDKLSPERKALCRELLNKLNGAAEETQELGKESMP